VIDVSGPENLTLDQLVEITEHASGHSGRVTHTPRPAMRLLSVALRPIDRMRAGQIGAALFMDTHDMTIDGPTGRAAYRTIPITSASTVADRLFHARAVELSQKAAT